MRKHPLILAVDDEPIILKTLRDTLHAEGFRVITTSNAISAMFLLGDRKPDLILLDIMMPKIDGFQALEMIRDHSDVPVIMLTCVDDKTALQKTMGELCADDYVTKPYSLEVLIARIKAKMRLAEKCRV
ncbi:MAG: response regulator [Dehalococcoidia bacterium]|nr:MAG: response regulator [Dehalococcoidia bacterium]